MKVYLRVGAGKIGEHLDEKADGVDREVASDLPRFPAAFDESHYRGVDLVREDGADQFRRPRIPGQRAADEVAAAELPAGSGSYLDENNRAVSSSAYSRDPEYIAKVMELTGKYIQ